MYAFVFEFVFVLNKLEFRMKQEVSPLVFFNTVVVERVGFRGGVGIDCLCSVGLGTET
jgi:hypothetical protein